MSVNTVNLLRSLSDTLTYVNVGIAALAHIKPAIPLAIQAANFFLSNFLQRYGNAVVPPPKPADPPPPASMKTAA